jgi:DNA-binding NarL/FixJ family response regulator
MSVRVGIVEDDPRLRESFASLVSSGAGLTCVAACASAEEALDVMPREAPDVILMDINLPGLSGTECTRLLKTTRPDLQVVMLTSFDDTDSIVASLAAGATGYVLKRASGEQILQAVRDVHEGGSPMTGAIARKVVQLMSRGSRPALATRELHAAVDQLTERERAVLSALSQGQQYKEVADTLGISINTVRKHIKAIYEKLQVNSRLDAVRKAGHMNMH